MKRILFFGDSLTAGYGLSRPEEHSFPALIQQMLNEEGLAYQAINAGLSGDTSGSGLQRLSYWIQQPMDVFVLELGANDMLRGLPSESTEANLQEIIDRVLARYPNVKLVLLGMQLPLWVPGQSAAEFRIIYQQVAVRNNMTFVPFLLEGVAGLPHLNMQDGIHPLAEGYQIIAKNVWASLKQIL